MQSTTAPVPPDLAYDVVRALVLYALAEVQSGHATVIRVAVEGTSFTVGDNGRGHAVQRTVEGVPYLKFVYEHLGYPFAAVVGPPAQLQGLGMSLINALCSNLQVTVRKREGILQQSFEHGCTSGVSYLAADEGEPGNTVAGTINPLLQRHGVHVAMLRQWLRNALSVNSSLELHLNGERLQAEAQSAT
jgi:DNA gyrase subunit B